SENPVKIESTRKGFEEVFKKTSGFEFIGKSISSGVGDQPMTNEETLLGAGNRAQRLKAKFPGGDFFVGIEGGIQTIGDEMEAFAWVVILDERMAGKAQTSTFQLPSEIVELVSQGIELGHADDMVFQRKNSKQGNGAVGILTNNVIDRVEYYRHAVILALIPFINKELYK
ncbi:MAG: inosine/xanthosine triphosphatase, partial [Cyclobacteriaceae bacterium]|nr:inosine/xanthosine triphosphatase [Cyclobacteriaceae bacterium]